MKKILLIATGGTIACSDSGDGLKPSFGVNDLLSHIPAYNGDCKVTGELIMNIDSTNMNPTHWGDIGAVIEKNYELYDGFVVTHGTDTLAYTSAGMSYILNGLKKPVIVTGAQHSISEFGTDAKQNLSDAIRYALEGVPGVFVAFDGKIINGTRAMKVKTKSLDAFSSVNYPYVARVKYGKVYHNEELKIKFMQDAFGEFSVDSVLCPDIMVLKLFPGMDTKIFDFIKDNYKGLVIESFGIGGIPFENNDITSKVKELVMNGMPVVVTTQCLEEGIDFEIYEVGRKLVNSNIIFAKNMNTEAIVAKLMWAVGKGHSLAEVKYLMEEPKMDDCLKYPSQVDCFGHKHKDVINM